ncbi:hypothetical protein EBR77_01710 [bacterium]|nr:hypothetical protein [bacterium]NBX78682.1 hypothetical protein [bacterium]
MNLRTVVGLSAITFLVDRFTKHIAYNVIMYYQINSWLAWVTTVNTGISWGMLQGFDQHVLIGINGALLFWLLAWTKKGLGYVPWYIALVVTGAFSNIIDRLVYGGVVDFISVQIFGWQFPIFNLADCVIVLGILYFMYVHTIGGVYDE